MTTRSFLAVFITLCLTLAAAAQTGIGIGDTREDVLRRVGKPSSTARRGDREIVLFPGGGRIEFVDGKVVDVKGNVPMLATPTPETPAAESSPPPAPVAQPPPEPAIAEPAAAGGAPKLTPTEQLSREMQASLDPETEKESLTGLHYWLALVMSVAMHFGITLFALKMAFKYWEMDALWTGTLAIAGIDTVVFAVCELLGPVTSELSQMPAVQGGIGTLVMIPVIQKFCFSKSLQNAVLTAFAVKLIVQLCHMFLFVVVINSVF